VVWKYALFLHIFAHFLFSKVRFVALWKERQKVRLHNRTFEKSNKKVRSHNRTFEKCNKKWDRTIVLFKSATKSAIAQSHFWKVQKCARCDCAIAQLWFWLCSLSCNKYFKILQKYTKNFFQHKSSQQPWQVYFLPSSYLLKWKYSGSWPKCMIDQQKAPVVREFPDLNSYHVYTSYPHPWRGKGLHSRQENSIHGRNYSNETKSQNLACELFI